jgi:hypothetical protein
MRSARITRYCFSKRRSHAKTEWVERQGGGLVIRLRYMFEAMFTVSERNLAQNPKLAPAASNRRRPVLLAEAFGFHHISCLHHSFPKSSASRSDHSLNISCWVLPHGWSVASLGKSTIEFGHTGLARMCMTTLSQSLINCDKGPVAPTRQVPFSSIRSFWIDLQDGAARRPSKLRR